MLQSEVLAHKGELMSQFKEVAAQNTNVKPLSDQLSGKRGDIQQLNVKIVALNRQLEDVAWAVESVLTNPDIKDYPTLLRKLMLDHFPTHGINAGVEKETHQQVFDMSKKICNLVNYSEKQAMRGKFDLRKRRKRCPNRRTKRRQTTHEIPRRRSHCMQSGTGKQTMANAEPSAAHPS